MDQPLSKSRRLKALGQAYLPSPRTKPRLLKLTLTRTNRVAKHSVKRSLEQKHTHNQSSALPLTTAKTKASLTELASPKAKDAMSSRLMTTQYVNSSSLTLNQSTSKNISNTSLFSQRRSHGSELPVIKDDLHYPLTPGQALKRFIGQLTEYEQAEILEYKEIYFLGLNAQKIVPSLSAPNCGYDDDRADYRVVEGDHVAYRYEVLGMLGKGSFGQVLRCIDHKRNEVVALKIIRNKQRFHVQGTVEVRVLETLRDNDVEDTMGVIRMKNYMVFRKHICMTFELLSLNLYEFLQVNNFQGVSIALVRRFAVPLLVTLGYVRENHIIHCDLKPENILLRQPNRSGIKVIDFGSSCFDDSRVYTYIQSRFYRAPEIILGIPYTTAIDMWSLGCILAELFTGYPLFPGESEKEQLQCIMEVYGVPPKDVLESGSRTKLFFNDDLKPILIPNSRGLSHLPASKTLDQVLHCPDKLFLDFLERCFEWDPETRITPIEALQHPWTMEGILKETSKSTAHSHRRKTSRLQRDRSEGL